MSSCGSLDNPCNNDGYNNLSQTIPPKVGDSYPVAHWCVSTKDCIQPPLECFPTIVVRPRSNAADAAQLLDEHISLNTTESFFNDSNNVKILFPDAYGKVIEDLKSGNMTLWKRSGNLDERFLYHVRLKQYPDSVLDYSPYYQD